MVQASRSSGVLLEDKIVFSGQCKLMSIHTTNTTTDICVLKVYDGIDNTGIEVARITVGNKQTIEFDMHGVLCKTGIFYEEVDDGLATSIEFQ